LIHLAQDRNQLKGDVRKVMNFQVPYGGWGFLD